MCPAESLIHARFDFFGRRLILNKSLIQMLPSATHAKSSRLFGSKIRDFEWALERALFFAFCNETMRASSAVI